MAFFCGGVVAGPGDDATLNRHIIDPHPPHPGIGTKAWRELVHVSVAIYNNLVLVEQYLRKVCI